MWMFFCLSIYSVGCLWALACIFNPVFDILCFSTARCSTEQWIRHRILDSRYVSVRGVWIYCKWSSFYEVQYSSKRRNFHNNFDGCCLFRFLCNIQFVPRIHLSFIRNKYVHYFSMAFLFYYSWIDVFIGVCIQMDNWFIQSTIIGLIKRRGLKRLHKN